MKYKIKSNFIQSKLSASLKSLGQQIGRHPLYFIVLPFFLSAILATGIIKMHYNRDFVYLYTAENGKAIQNRNIVEKLFPSNSSYNMDVFRYTKEPEGVMIIATAKNGRTVLTVNVFEEINLIDELVKNFSIVCEERIINFESICGRGEGHCLQNPIYKLTSHIKKFEEGRYNFKYPLDIDYLTYAYTRYIINLGGVIVDKDRYVRSAKAIRLLYPFDSSNVTKANCIRKWEYSFTDNLRRIKFDHITLSAMGMSSLATEIKKYTDTLFPLTIVVCVTIALFSMVTSMTNSWVKSKPWLGVASSVSAGLAVASSFGFLFHCGLSNTDMNVALPFLIMATEIDDAYVLISAWRRTNPKDSVDKRMGETYAEAAVSITITSLTNFLSFCIGVTTPFPVVRIFCVYASVCIFFTYAYQITFFGAWMAISGYREERNLHPFTLMPVSDSEIIEKQKEKKENQDQIASFFKYKLGKLLCLKPVKILVIVSFLINLCGGLWGLMHLNDGMDVTSLLSSKSITREGVMRYYRYFAQYPYPIHIVINETLDYSNATVQSTIENLLLEFENHPHTSDEYLTLSWLKYYKTFASSKIARFSLANYNLSVKQDFIDGVRNVFLQLSPAMQFSNDIVFNDGYTDIVASRFIIASKNIYDRKTELELFRDLQKICDRSSLSVIMHSLVFPLLEHALTIRGIVFQLAWVVGLLIILIFIAFIPNLTCAVCVSLAVVAVICETVGYMALWDVNLDMVTVVVLILSVGFSINYPTHVSFAFVMAKSRDANERLKQSLYEVGWPIFQGSASTVLGVLLLAFQDSYIYLSFFKIVFLISVETGFHAMFVLPVVLSIVNVRKLELKSEQTGLRNGDAVVVGNGGFKGDHVSKSGLEKLKHNEESETLLR